jgi:VWFA-related protein
MQSLTRMRYSTVLALPLLTLAGVLLKTGGTAQQAPSTPALASKSATHDVMLPVTVRDKKGALVTDLRKTDLTLSEDGRPQTIKSFSRETDQPVRVGLLIDTSHGVSGALNEERKAATQLVDAVLPVTGETKDQVFLIHFDREVELLEDFTNSREKVSRAGDMIPSRSATTTRVRDHR